MDAEKQTKAVIFQVCEMRMISTLYTFNSIQFNSFSDLEDPSMQRKMNMLM